MVKTTKLTSKKILELVNTLKEAEVYERYISSKGRAFIDGILSTGEDIEMVSLEDYKEVRNRSEEAQRKLINREYY